MYRTSTRDKVGDVSVDSGQVLIVDPCYLHDWKADDFDGDVPSDEQQKEYPFTYTGACAATLSPRSAGQVGLAVASSSGWGDGTYPVYAEREGGRIIRLVIEFDLWDDLGIDDDEGGDDLDEGEEAW